MTDNCSHFIREDAVCFLTMPQPGTKKFNSLLRKKAEFIEPMDCAPVSKLPDGLDWTFEIKLDGYRAIAVKADGP